MSLLCLCKVADISFPGVVYYLMLYGIYNNVNVVDVYIADINKDGGCISLSLFISLYFKEAKISQTQALPSHAGDVNWSLRLCRVPTHTSTCLKTNEHLNMDRCDEKNPENYGKTYLAAFLV